MTIHVTPIPSTIDLTTPAFSMGVTNTAGASTAAVSSNSTLLAFDTTNPADLSATAATGSATVASRRDHVHPGFDTTVPVVLAITAATGSAAVASRRDHVHPGFDATVPAAIADTAATGSATVASRRDHVHASGTAAVSYTGTYTGDGGTSLAITGVGFTPKVVGIWPSTGTDDTQTDYLLTTTPMIDNHGLGMTWQHLSGSANPVMRVNRIIALNADGFTVDDAGGDANPNKAAQVYDFWCLG